MSGEQKVRVVPNNSFFEQVKDWLKEGKKVKIPVVGRSMFPTLKNGDTVLLAPMSKMQLGDIVLATYNNAYILHRVVGWDTHGVRLVGDGNIGQVEWVNKDEIWARVVDAYRADLKIERTDWKWRFFGLCWYVLRPLRATAIKSKKIITKFSKTNTNET